MKLKLNFIFSCGYRCLSTDVLKNNNIRKMSCPFDYLFIDLESVFKIINNNFENFLNDIIIYNKNENKNELIYKKNYIETDNNLNLLENVSYMKECYNNNTLLFNKNYTYFKIKDKKTMDLYEFESICEFHHHDITNDNVYEKMKIKIDRFINILKKDYSIAMLYITRILKIENINVYINNILILKKKYNINYYLIIVVNCDNLEDQHYLCDNNLFIIKKVKSYEIQTLTNLTDNIDSYYNEFNIIQKYFTFDLI